VEAVFFEDESSMSIILEELAVVSATLNLLDYGSFFCEGVECFNSSLFLMNWNKSSSRFVSSRFLFLVI
jgi:hypothetical protein